MFPIGILSEEAHEAMYKDMKKFRENNTRKIYRKHTMEDFFLNLLISSDPFISKLRKINNKKLTPLCTEAKLLIFKEDDIEDVDDLDKENCDKEVMEYEETE